MSKKVFTYQNAYPKLNQTFITQNFSLFVYIEQVFYLASREDSTGASLINIMIASCNKKIHSNLELEFILKNYAPIYFTLENPSLKLNIGLCVGFCIESN